MAAAKHAPSTTVHQLKVTLKGVRPPIWRRIQVPSDVTLAKLHRILQATMGWEGYHLHQFVVGSAREGTIYGVPDRDDFDWGFGLPDIKDERRAKLTEIAPEAKAKFRYEYDFGDDWEHDIVVENVLPREPGPHVPVCLAGKRATPPEDCGGVWGYAVLLEILQNPNDPEYEDRKEWLGGGLDPEAFDLESINRQLARIR